VATERSKTQHLEAEHGLLDRQNKELRAKLEELESQHKARMKAAQQASESKIANLEEQLEAELKLVLNLYNLLKRVLKGVKCRPV